MLFYPSKTNDKLNRRLFEPERVAGRVMVNPRYPVRRLARGAPWWCPRCRIFHTFPRVRCDSGAFQDIGAYRLFPWQALEAQLRYEEQLRWWLDDETFHFDVLFIYDDPAGVDEAMIDGKKVKVRGDETSAALAVESTLAAAAHYAKNRGDIRGRIGWVGQGIDADQYTKCIIAQRHYFRHGDIIGLGGFCIWGRMPARMTETAHETITRVVDWGRMWGGVREFHLLGVMYAPAIRWAASLARKRRVRFATDGSGPEQAACISGAVYREDGTQNHGVYTKEQKYKEYHPCDLALSNIATYNAWASSLSTLALS